jgi:hypothetical protein
MIWCSRRLRIYGVRMFVSVVKMTSRIVGSLLFAITLSLLAFAVAAVSMLGVTLALQGWVANPPTTIHAPLQP